MYINGHILTSAMMERSPAETRRQFIKGGVGAIAFAAAFDLAAESTDCPALAAQKKWFHEAQYGFIGTTANDGNTPVIKQVAAEVRILNEEAISKKLIDMGFFDLSIRPDADVDGLKVKGMNVNLVEVYDMLEKASNDMQEIFAVQ